MPAPSSPIFVRESQLLAELDERARGCDPGEAARRWLQERFRRRAAPLHVYFESSCAQSCEFCEVPLLRDDRRYQVLQKAGDERRRGPNGLVTGGWFEALLSSAADFDRLRGLTLTGHDLLGHPQLDRILELLARHPPPELRLQGPSTRLSDPALVARVAALPNLRAVALTLQSSDPMVHDQSVGAPGAGEAVQRAIENLRAAGTPTETALIVTRASLPTLVATLRWAAAHELRVAVTCFRPDETTARRTDVFATFDAVRRTLDQVAVDDIARGAVESLVGLPRCAVPTALRSHVQTAAQGDRSDPMVHPAEPCGVCDARARCDGVSASYVDRHGATGLTALSPQKPAKVSRRTSRRRLVTMVLPPDYHAPEGHLEFRFPPLGPAVVAASLADLSIETRAADLAAQCFMAARPEVAIAALDDPRAVEAHLSGREHPAIAALLDDLLGHLEPWRECDAVGISVDRGSQTALAALLSFEIKRRWEKRVIVGGVATHHVRGYLERSGAAGADIVTAASTPAELSTVFGALFELPERRRAEPLDPNTRVVELVRKGMRKAPTIDGWPMPDFGIYDLDVYRRDVVARGPDARTPEDDRLSRSLVLPYFFALECQFACSFCQSGGNQEARPPEQIVRELAELSETWEVGEFLFFNAQSNLLSPGLSQALIDARLDLRWSDSYRVRPRAPGDLELMARAGCAGLTVGVESASDRVLKSMVKGHRSEHASEMLREAHALEIMLRVNVLTCFPGETKEELRQTCDWIEEHAGMIDDLAPSSFYLTKDSPVGREPERFGIQIRGTRQLDGPTKFRKSPDSMTYDEVGGMTWEERSPMLEQSEVMVLDAWRRGRGATASVSGLSPSTMLSLRRQHATKADVYASLSAARSRPEESAPRLNLADLKPRLHGPAHPSKTAVHRLRFVLRESFDVMAPRVKPGVQMHALLFHDARVLVFRGSVTRDVGTGSVRELTVEEVVLDRGVDWPRRELLGEGDAGFEVVSFSLDARR